MTLSARLNIAQLTGCKEGSLLLLANGKGEPLKITASIREKKSLSKAPFLASKTGVEGFKRPSSRHAKMDITISYHEYF